MKRFLIACSVCFFLLPSAFAEQVSYFDSLYLDFSQQLSEQTAQTICAPQAYSTENVDAVNACHLLSGTVTTYKAPELSTDVQVTMYHVDQIGAQIFEYREVEHVVALLRNYFDAIDGTISAQQIGADGKEVFFHQGELMSGTTAVHLIENNGKTYGIGFFYVEGFEHERVKYQAVFYNKELKILGAITIPVEVFLDHTWVNFRDKQVGSSSNQSTYRATLTDYVSQLLETDEMQSVLNIVVHAVVTQSTTANDIAPTTSNTTSQSSSTSFSDVPSDHMYAEAIAYVQQQGYVQGYADGTYKPEQSINRAEFLKLILSMYVSNNAIENTTTECFGDVVQNSWYARFVCYAKEQHIVKGYDDGSFKPASTINQAEAIKMLLLVAGATVEAATDDQLWFEPYMQLAIEYHLFNRVTRNPSATVTRGQMAEFIYQLTH